MADILIRGMEIPKDGRITIQVGADGAVYFVEKCTILAEKYDKSSHAMPLPKGHGRCIDADEISGSLAESATFKYNKRTSVCWSDAFLSMIDMLDDAPTIVPAEGGTDDGNP